MTPELDFERRLAGIHGLGRSPKDVPVSKEGGDSMDVRHAEFHAMVDAFLGIDFDPGKRRAVEELQLDFHDRQAALSRQHDQGSVSDEQFAEAANGMMEETLRRCEMVLGREHFAKLFGMSSPESGRLIDQAMPVEPARTAPATGAFAFDTSCLTSLYTNFCRVSVTPEELILDFGLNPHAAPHEAIQLTQRLAMSYYTAKRLTNALVGVVSQFEQSYGKLELDFQRRVTNPTQQRALAMAQK